MPLTLEHASELSYPVPADSSTGLLLVLANLIGTGLIFACTALLNLQVSAECSSVFNPFAYFMAAAMVVGAAVTLFVKKDYRRSAVTAAAVVAAAV